MLSQEKIRKLKRMILDLEDLMANTENADDWYEISQLRNYLEKLINKK